MNTNKVTYVVQKPTCDTEIKAHHWKDWAAYDTFENARKAALEDRDEGCFPTRIIRVETITELLSTYPVEQ